MKSSNLCNKLRDPGFSYTNTFSVCYVLDSLDKKSKEHRVLVLVEFNIWRWGWGTGKPAHLADGDAESKDKFKELLRPSRGWETSFSWVYTCGNSTTPSVLSGKSQTFEGEESFVYQHSSTETALLPQELLFVICKFISVEKHWNQHQEICVRFSTLPLASCVAEFRCAQHPGKN